MFAFYCCGLLGTLNWFLQMCRKVQRSWIWTTCSHYQWMGWKFVELLQEEHREQCGGAQLQIIGSCGLHTIHNSFKSGFSVWQVEKVLKALHYLFHCAPARREDFVSVTKCDTFPLPFCRHWLENIPAVERAIEIWPYIVTCVDQVKAKKLPNPRSSSYDTIAEAWMDHFILAKLHFFMSVSRSFQPFRRYQYQTDAPMISFFGRDLEDLIRVGLMTTKSILMV